MVAVGSRINAGAHYFEWLMIGLLAWAMGLQNSTLTHFSSLTLNAGFVTGTLSKFGEQFVKYGAWLWDECTTRRSTLRQAVSRSGQEPAFRMSAFLLLIWLTYIFGAAVGAYGTSIAGTETLVLPIACLLVLVAADIWKPLAREEEQQQAQPD